jgi:ferrous iron transport protein B
VALNKSDLSEKKGTKINVEKLSNRLGCPVINTVSTTGEGLKEVVEAAISVVGSTQKKPYSQGEVDLNDKSAVEAADRKRFDFVNKIVEEVETRKILTKDKNFGDKIDAVLTNKWLGIPIFVIVMFLVFYISQAEGPLGLGKYLEGVLTGAIDSFQGYVADLMVNTSPLLQSIVVEGIIGGISAVLGFLPLVMVMYFLIALLEDCGYMARVAVVLDPIFKKVGLSGKSVIPFVISIGCAVPGIMACRTIRNERERRVTAMLAPFMPCGAKIPVIGLFAGAFFDNASWVSTLVYFTGIALIFLGALLVNKIVGHKARKSFFIIELPEYKIPSLWGAFKTMMSRGWAYIVKAATIIMLCNLAVHLMQTFTWSFTVAESADQSILASIASPFAYLLVPIVGVLSWQLAAAAVTGLIAKENVVGTLAVCFVGLENLIDVEEFALLEGAGAEVAGIIAITKIAALAYLMFNLYTPPCFAAIGSMNSEMKSAKWLWGGIALQLGVGYTVAYFVYTIGTIITGATLNVAAAVGGFMAVLVMVAIVAGLILNTNKKLKSEYELSNVNN